MIRRSVYTILVLTLTGLAGLAPLLVAELEPDGRFVRGRIHSAHQIRPGGTVWDPQQRAFELIRELTERTFGATLFEFDGDGGFTAAPSTRR